MNNETIRGGKSYSFPINQEFSNIYLQENFWKCLYTSIEENLHYWVILPKNVKPNKLEPIIIHELSLLNIGQYIREDSSPYLEVQVAYEHYIYEMNASDWLKKKLHIMGEEIIQERIIKGKSTGDYIDVLCRKNISGTDIISRFTVLKDYDITKGGANYICVKVSCEEKDYENLCYTILQIATNWDLLNKSDWQMAELLTPFTDNFVEPVKFFVPNSWEANAFIKTNSEFSHYIFEHIVDGKNKGVINTFFHKSVAYTQIEDVLKSKIKRFTNEIEGLSCEIIEVVNIEKNEIRNPKIEELYNVFGNMSSQNSNFFSNLMISVIKTNNGWYYFESIGPKPNLVNNYWEVNKRALEIMIDSFDNLSFESRI